MPRLRRRLPRVAPMSVRLACGGSQVPALTFVLQIRERYWLVVRAAALRSAPFRSCAIYLRGNREAPAGLCASELGPVANIGSSLGAIVPLVDATFGVMARSRHRGLLQR